MGLWCLNSAVPAQPGLSAGGAALPAPGVTRGDAPHAAGRAAPNAPPRPAPHAAPPRPRCQRAPPLRSPPLPSPPLPQHTWPGGRERPYIPGARGGAVSERGLSGCSAGTARSRASRRSLCFYFSSFGCPRSRWLWLRCPSSVLSLSPPQRCWAAAFRPRSAVSGSQLLCALQSAPAVVCLPLVGCGIAIAVRWGRAAPRP